MNENIVHGAVSFGAAFTAGIINSVAGGGTLLTFPTLVWLGLPPIIANATSTVAIWPGGVGAMWGYRRELSRTPGRLLALVAPSLIGGIGGALLLRSTPQSAFKALVPYLILFATLLFLAQEPVQRALKARTGPAGPPERERTLELAARRGSVVQAKSSGALGGEKGHTTTGWLAGAMVFQLFVALYGGYFGAGIGILMLAALSILGLDDIHQMNGLKMFFALCINGVAAVYFIYAGMVFWPDVILMAAGAILGGYGGAGLARKMGRPFVRGAVIFIGFAMALSLFVKQ
ncbi:MAG: sulfite exporter TauE/SafE family protein [Bryobacterales bacterium]|nr:sulfite exporter TauE/SafE family protein [Bryobacterales bacterium]